MRCPACGSELAEMVVADLRVDVCRGGCGGIWFDHRELAKVDDREESASQTLLDIERRPDVKVDHGAPRVCPRCGRPHIMTRHFYYSPKREVEVDECSRCEGVWLDPGELVTIRAQFADAAERQAVFGRVLERMRREAEEQMAHEFGPPTQESASAPLPAVSDAAHVATLLARVFRLLRSGLG